MKKKYTNNSVEETRKQRESVDILKGYTPSDYYEAPRGKSTIVGSFGIVEGDGYINIMHWAVSPERRDKRHGVVRDHASSIT